MKPADIRELTSQELTKAMADHRKDLFSMRMKAKTGQLENPSAIRKVRKNLARMITIEAQKQK
jgi:large subunit ribosomal protein L29